ncbi:hypothetical protein PK35_07675 [Tamlana nanhaiensis]|uniref:YhhN-like protein n=1 Tax=Neotamlana nanhaiensis TaxID=1382798 RepID=A0A0D7W147_9FLAO|nr:hypothetical protein PK35_07675 [Tamlana nanhaiensis]
MSQNKIFKNVITNKLNVLDILLGTSFLASIILSIIKSKQQLLFTIPLVIVCISLKYIVLAKHKFKVLFLVALAFILAADILIFKNFQANFTYISVLTTLCLLCYILIIKQYLKNGKFQGFLSASVLLSIALVAYVLFSVFKVLVLELPKKQIILSALCLFCFSLYFTSIGIIYLKSYYKNGILLFISGIAYFFQLIFSIINEFLHFERTFTVLIIICHVTSVYLFMKFILEVKSTEPYTINFE